MNRLLLTACTVAAFPAAAAAQYCPWAYQVNKLHWQQQLVQQARKLQQQLAKIQEDLANETVTGTSGGGAVQIALNGHGEIQKVTIEPSAVDHQR